MEPARGRFERRPGRFPIPKSLTSPPARRDGLGTQASNLRFGNFDFDRKKCVVAFSFPAPRRARARHTSRRPPPRRTRPGAMWTSTALHRCGVLALPAGGRAGAPRAVSRVARPPPRGRQRSPSRRGGPPTRRAATRARRARPARRRAIGASRTRASPLDRRASRRGAATPRRRERRRRRRAVHARDPAGSTDRDEPAVGAPSRSRSRAGVRARATGPEPGTTLRPTVGGRVRDEFPRNRPR